MSPLDDDALRDRLDRRVQSSSLSADERNQILGSVATGRASPRRSSTWTLGGRWIGFAAAALSLILVAAVVLKSPGEQGPATSPPPGSAVASPPKASPPDAPTPVASGLATNVPPSEPPNTAPQVFSAQELSDMIGGDRVGDVVLARAGIRQVITDPKFCPPPGPCQNSELADVSAPNVVAVGWRTAPEGQGTRVTHGVIVRWLVRLSIPDGPVLGAFKILTDAVEYLGPVVDSDGGDIVWSVSDIQAGEHNVPADDLYAVEGWLVKTPPAPCPAPPDYGSGTDSAYWCGGSFVTQALTRPSSTPNVLDPGGLHVQWDSYDDFAPNPALDAQDGAEPRLGTYLVRSAGCPPVVMGECPVWSMVGRLDHLSPSAEAFPREIDGEPVLTVEEATARITSSDSAEPFLVGGWVVFVIGDCFEPPCGDGFLIRSRPLGRGGDSEFASLRLVVDETTGAFPIGMDPTVLRVHPHDPLAAECPPDCRLAIVVDDVVWPTSLPTPQPAPSGAVSDSPPLAVGNWTTLRIWVDVDGMDTAVLEPGQVIDPITPGMLPALPWIVTARTSTGRVLLTLTIRETDGWPSSPDPSGGSTVHGAAARVDLSCGRIDIWAGPPLAGPGPPQSFPPGDCDP